MPPSLWSQEGYLAAWRFAATAHLGQQMPGSCLPYIVHLSAVAMEIMTAIGLGSAAEAPTLAVQCALLHDVLEDTPVRHEELVARFGSEVADGVLALTKDQSLPSARRMADSLRRIRQQPRAVWMVKLADRITNLQPPPAHWTADRIAAYREEAQEIHRALAEGDAFLAGRLQEKIRRYPPAP